MRGKIKHGRGNIPSGLLYIGYCTIVVACKNKEMRSESVKHPALRSHPLYERGQGISCVPTLPSLAKRGCRRNGGCFVESDVVLVFSIYNVVGATVSGRPQKSDVRPQI